jgi:ubiquinone/menaquinone biosynthesis C-methylase UbiE
MLIQTLLFICILLAILATFSRRKHKPSKLNYAPAYTGGHADVYDAIVYDSIKNEAEVSFLSSTLTPESTVLDVGSGTGHHVDLLKKKGVNAVGIDLSTDMIVRAKQRYSHTYIQGDALNMATFPSESFTHITCLYYTIYCMKQKERFFQNAHYWLIPGGYLAVHVTKNWDYGPTSTLSGTLQYSSKHTRRVHRECITQNGVMQCYEHAILMEPEENIVDMATRAGFIIQSIYTYSIPYKNQRLYLFIRL